MSNGPLSRAKAAEPTRAATSAKADSRGVPVRSRARPLDTNRIQKEEGRLPENFKYGDCAKCGRICVDLLHHKCPPTWEVRHEDTKTYDDEWSSPIYAVDAEMPADIGSEVIMRIDTVAVRKTRTAARRARHQAVGEPTHASRIDARQRQRACTSPTSCPKTCRALGSNQGGVRRVAKLGERFRP